MGMKISVAHSMMPRVRWLETLSHTVRLASGSMDEGMMTGNSAAPAVPITPATTAATAAAGLAVGTPATQLR